MSWSSLGNSELVDGASLLDAVNNSLFILVDGQSIPNNDKCVTTSQASTLVHLDTSFLPSDPNKLPIKSQFISNSSSFRVRSSSAFCLQSEINLSNFDYLVIRYIWETGDGIDLDTFTGFENTGTSYDGDPLSRINWVGYAQNPVSGSPTGIPPDNRIIPQGSSIPYLNWGTDNTTGAGVEAILVNFAQFITDNPSTSNPIQIRMNAVWYNTLQSGDITVQITTYSGGTMSLVGTDFVNSGGSMVNNVSLPVNIGTQSTAAQIANSQDVAVVSYDITTSSATLTLT